MYVRMYGRRGGAKKRILVARITRYHVTEGVAVSIRNRTHNRIVDHARSLLYTDIGRQLADTIVEHYAADKTRPIALGAPPAEVARLLRLDGPSITALVRALQVSKEQVLINDVHKSKRRGKGRKAYACI